MLVSQYKNVLSTAFSMFFFLSLSWVKKISMSFVLTNTYLVEIC